MKTYIVQIPKEADVRTLQVLVSNISEEYYRVVEAIPAMEVTNSIAIALQVSDGVKIYATEVTK